MALPFKSHPLFILRKAIIIIALIVLVLCFVGPSYLAGFSAWLLVSLAFCALDVYIYATKKAENPDEDPKWPTVLWIVGDLLLSLIQQFVFWAALAALSYRYYSYYLDIVAAYAALANFLCSYVATSVQSLMGVFCLLTRVQTAACILLLETTHGTVQE
jgi:hypothetical protein